MSDHSELKKLAEACGDLNWRAIQENWTELAIRDDHGYIATMRTKNGKHAGPCPDREAKAKFLCAVTPVAVLALIAEVEALRKLAPSKEIIWCACGDGYPVNSYGAGFMDASNGVCANCDAAMNNGEQT